MYATKEAILAKQRLGEGVNCSVFIMDERAFNKEYSSYFAKARQEHRHPLRALPGVRIREDPQYHELILHYVDANGQTTEERFDMVVLAIGLQPPDSAQHFAEMLDLELNEYGFCQTDKFTPLQTTHSGVFVCGAFSSPKEISETILDASGAAAEVMRLLNERLNTYPATHEFPFLSASNLPAERDVSEAPACGHIRLLMRRDHRGSDRYPESWPQRPLNFQGAASSEVLEFACFPERSGSDQGKISRRSAQPHRCGCLQQPHARVLFPTGCTPGGVEPLSGRAGQSAGTVQPSASLAIRAGKP